MADKQFYHLGHKILECFRNHPDAICKIDAATGESETNGSVLSRSIRLATSLTALGLVPGDVLALSGKNHLDISIPYYTALFNGLPLVAIDPYFRIDEIKHVFKLTSPKVAFCDPKDYDNYVKAAHELELDTKVFTFGDGPHSMKALIEEHGKDIKEEDFRLPEFDLQKVYCFLICTSGSTGNTKIAAFRHAPCLKKAYGFIHAVQRSNSDPVASPYLNLSPVQWVSGIFYSVTMPLMGKPILHTSAPLTVEHVVDIINKYRPMSSMFSPTLISGVLAYEPLCDLTCFDFILVSGAKMPEGLIARIQSRMRKNAKAGDLYGQTETMGPAIFFTPDTPPSSCGSPNPLYQVQLVDPETETVISEPNTPGEFWAKGVLFTEYYNDPEETAKAFSKDGWFKSGDLMYRDEHDNYYYLSRIKSLIKYQNYHVVPGELEDVIRSHPGVSDVAVIGVPHALDGEHPVACVVRRHGSDVTAQEIKDLVANKLSEKKQLRGGVVFLQALPRLSTGKVDFKELRRIAETVDKE